jgi:hypothetical protein
MKDIRNIGIAPHIPTLGDDGWESSASYLGYLIQGRKSFECPFGPRAGLDMKDKIKISIPAKNRADPLILIIGLCILLCVYQLNIGITSVRNKVFFSARFYCALLTLHVSAPFGGHLQVVHKHKKMSKVVTIYLTDPLSRHV